MKAGLLFLVLGYFLSQFYRSFLAVLTPVLGAEIGTTSADLSFASGMWFLTFAAMQIPVGWALDRFGPKLTASVLLAFGGGGGAVVFAMAEGPGAVTLAMALFGIGGSPVLMASYFIFARMFPQAMFSTLAGAMIGFGSAGNLAGSAPLAMAVSAWGWRNTMWGLGFAALLVALALMLVLRDPPAEPHDEAPGGNLLTLLTNRNLLLLFPLLLVNYAPAMAIRGLWAGPYLTDVFAMDEAGIGRVTLFMALAMALGNLLYGPAERLLGSKKTVVLAGNLAGAAACLTLWAMPASSPVMAASMFVLIGLFGASYPVLMAHGQLFIPRRLTGRGITLLNLFGIGGVGLMQFLTSAMARTHAPDPVPVPGFYSDLFLLFALSLLAGTLIYTLCAERPAKG
ncbi:MAG: MFS transporter [Rhodobacteraceae bacterium]|nr:MFS transporter [Paracoccaceae bacterium]